MAETGAPTVGAAQLLVRLYGKDRTTLIYELALLTGIQTDVNGEQVAVDWGYGITPIHTSVAGGITLSANADILKLAVFMKLVLEVTTANDGTTSTASETDMVVRLVDVEPDGRSLNILEGSVRGAGNLRVDLAATAHLFGAGHGVRLHLASASFPRLAPNPRPARQRVFHTAETYLELTTAAV